VLFSCCSERLLGWFKVFTRPFSGKPHHPVRLRKQGKLKGICSAGGTESAEHSSAGTGEERQRRFMVS